MKKNWLSLLAVLLFAALAMACASAEVDEDLILGDGSDLEVQLEAADDGLVLEDDLSMDDVELPITEENDGISLDLSPEGLEPATVPADNAVASNDGAEDFEIINGILVKYKGAGGDVVIPNSVTVIGESAFSSCHSLTGVSIPDSVISIGDYEFSNCSSLTSISIGKGLTSISDEMFSGCQLLESIVLPANISSIHSGAFKNCYSLLDVTLLNCTMDIEDDAFSGCPTTMTFHTPCDSATTKWAKGKGYKVVKSDHTPVTDPAVAPTCAEAGKTEGSHCSVCGKVLVKQKKIPKLISLKKCKITGIKDAVYTGKAIKPAPVVKYKGKELVKGVDYTVKYTANKAVGAATVTVTGIGRYGESVSKTFKINPKAVALSKLTAGKRQLTVKWKKGKDITGYEVQYSLKKNFAGAKKIRIKNAATVETVLKKLTTGKKYYVRVRAYKTVSGKKYYSAWSKAKSAKVK